MSKRRRRDVRCRVAPLEGRAVPSIAILKAAIDSSKDIHIIGYIQTTPTQNLSLSVSTILDIKGRPPDVVTISPAYIKPLPVPTPKLPKGVRADTISGIFNATYSAPTNFKPDEVRKVVVNVDLLRSNGTRAESAKREQDKLERLTGSSPYL